MREQDVFVLADRALNDVVGQIKDDQWEMAMPPEFAGPDGETRTLREVVNSHAYDDAWVPDMLAGNTMDSVGAEKWRGDLLGDNPRASFAIRTDQACAAVEALDDPDRTVHCSFGDYKAREYLWQVNSFRGMRAHDIAGVIGVEAALSEPLVAGLLEELEPVADEWRQYGVFPTRVDVPADAPILDQLLGLTGRQPTSG